MVLLLHAFLVHILFFLGILFFQLFSLHEAILLNSIALVSHLHELLDILLMSTTCIVDTHRCLMTHHDLLVARKGRPLLSTRL